MLPRRTRVIAVDRDCPDPDVMAEAASLLVRGGLVAFPTETVYGLGAHAMDPKAVDAVFDAKGRPPTDPLIVHIASAADVDCVARDIPPLAQRLADAFWPGPLTMILPKRVEVPARVTAGLDTVAVRVPAHPVARALLAAAGVPIAAPSANRFSHPSPTRAAHVVADLDGRVDLVLDGGHTDIGIESTVIDLTTNPPIVRRPGGVTEEEIERVARWGADWMPGEASSGSRDDSSRSGAPRGVHGDARGGAQVSPGQLPRHYAPRARLTLFDGERAAVVTAMGAEARRVTGRGVRVGILAPGEDAAAVRADLSALVRSGDVVVQPYGARRDVPRAAYELFDSLRALDGTGVPVILATAPEGRGLGVAIRDRLTRAAEGRVVRL